MKSMTGYSKISQNIDGINYFVEIKSVNHKYLNIAFSIPSLFSAFEAYSIPIIQNYIKRGSVSIKVDIRGEFESDLIHPDIELAKSYLKAFSEIEKISGIESKMEIGQLLEIKEIFKMELNPQLEEKLWKGLENVIKMALSTYNKSREIEGANLKVYLDEQIKKIEKITYEMQTFEASNRQKYKEMLMDNLKNNFGDFEMNPERLEQEVIMTIQRADIGEEISRLLSHVSRTHQLMASDQDVGSELDFLFQEMGREMNTLSAKSKIPEVLNLVVEGKTAIKKLREQVQNVE